MRFGNTSGRRAHVERLLQRVLVGAALLSLLIVRATVAADESSRRSGPTPQTMLKSDRDAAESDYWLALAKAYNLRDPRARQAAVTQAKNDLKDSLETAKQRFDARQEIDRALGGGPYDPVINPANFVSGINNPYFPLRPGTTFVYEARTTDSTEHVEVSVTTATKMILGVRCVVVRDTATVDGQLEEDTTDWYAQDRNGNVWYFGESAKQYADGELVGIEGSWKAGVDGAKPGIIMEAHPRVGDLYRQEFALGVAEDMAGVVSLNRPVTVPYGSFAHCVQTMDFSPMDPGVFEDKYFAPGVGQVLTVEVATGVRTELIRIIHR